MWRPRATPRSRPPAATGSPSSTTMTCGLRRSSAQQLPPPRRPRPRGCTAARSSSTSACRSIEVYEAPPSAELADMLLAYNAVPAGASNVVARADAIREVGGYDETLSQLADWDLWIRLALAGAPGGMRGAADGLCPALERNARHRQVRADRRVRAARGEVPRGRRAARDRTRSRGPRALDGLGRQPRGPTCACRGRVPPRHGDVRETGKALVERGQPPRRDRRSARGEADRLRAAPAQILRGRPCRPGSTSTDDAPSQQARPAAASASIRCSHRQRGQARRSATEATATRSATAWPEAASGGLPTPSSLCSCSRR